MIDAAEQRDRVTFVVAGQPTAKGRPRAFVRNGQIGMRTPDQTVAYERAIGYAARPHFRTPIDGPVRLDIVAIFAMPVSWSKKRRAEESGGWHTSKPDRDNIEKAIKDALNGIAWVDDRQVADGSCLKVWGEVGEVRVTVTPLLTAGPWKHIGGLAEGLVAQAVSQLGAVIVDAAVVD